MSEQEAVSLLVNWLDRYTSHTKLRGGSLSFQTLDFFKYTNNDKIDMKSQEAGLPLNHWVRINVPWIYCKQIIHNVIDEFGHISDDKIS
jgi:hypothetical protein